MDLYDGWPFPREGKWCYCCKQDKPFSDFGRNRAKHDGLQNECKKCRVVAARKAYAKNPQINIEAVRRWRKANPERHRAADRKNRAQARKVLADWYVRGILRAEDIPIAPDTMALKRAQLQLTRSIRDASACQ